ncbi:ferrochelatase [Paenibacillus sp. TRM 82003]|uniref:ferrochelatase n=1 Tax=Kineococcus sp. TRM81007 TaxID=2925831 RepID=UPI001F59D0A3|nr:ferrochelatase [Kineococcus sp. TRM81007]MCI2240395.1 ferrochelatase [Kineococcus sp. TRM81007]MCI3927429.1 ferrochelatase [Paenibacillus sp. TRM 82003]
MSAATTSARPYDAVLLLSFGGPEGPDDVVPFLENVTRGRGIPRERLEAVAEHYLHFGGKSPINDQNRALLARLRTELDARGLADLPLLWGNRNWEPYATDVVREAHEAGARRFLVVFTSAYSSYSSCRQYREDLARTAQELADEGRRVEFDKIRHYFNHPAFTEVNARAVARALGEVPDGSRVVFVTHSIPDAMNDVSGRDGGAYVRQHLDVAAEVARRVGAERGGDVPWDLTYCSRSGPPSQPWLEPDVNDHLRALHEQGVPGVVVAPIGFVSDHMEVKFDLDTEAAETAGEIGLPFARAATVGADATFVAGLVDLIEERSAQARGERPEQPATGALGPSRTVCPVDCCRNLRADLPAATGEDYRAPAPAPA